ncbi:MAG TPA: CDP-diacylglycerol--glycerol-3-phosphate 3-phosphatidyltransferase [Steroidobacteraceae bacterium]|jgi:CDP-diacylglycerol--glycerol-3-phosphate 3-phosphatidyltransferase|nr:CDP-diacylglycerol--glycerol-3-phosphate 3-phosphatidyltransferase [Steroidobacteraceae bacterium]
MSTSTPGADGQSYWNLPNALTWLRILMIPAIFALFYLLPYPWADPAACAAFALAGITDSLDGYYARKLGQTSRLGAFLDPVADKLIVAAALVLIVSKDPRWFVVIVAVVIIGREIAVSALREWMAEIGARSRMKVTILAKYKTIMQIVGLSLLLFRQNLFGVIPTYKLGLLLTAIAAVLTLWSMVQYLRVAWPELRGSSRL